MSLDSILFTEVTTSRDVSTPCPVVNFVFHTHRLHCSNHYSQILRGIDFEKSDCSCCLGYELTLTVMYPTIIENPTVEVGYINNQKIVLIF